MNASGLRKVLETMGIFCVLIVVFVSIFVYIFIKIPITLKRVNCNISIFYHNARVLKNYRKDNLESLENSNKKEKHNESYSRFIYC